MSTKRTLSSHSETAKVEAFVREFKQQFNYVAQGTLFNIAQDCYGDEPEEVAEWALALAKHFMLRAGKVSDEALEALIEEKKKEAE